jgi:hypothetical protein
MGRSGQAAIGFRTFAHRDTEDTEVGMVGLGDRNSEPKAWALCPLCLGVNRPKMIAVASSRQPFLHALADETPYGASFIFNLSSSA